MSVSAARLETQAREPQDSIAGVAVPLVDPNEEHYVLALAASRAGA